MAEDRLVVYLDGIQTGILHQSQQGRLTFEYDDNYRVDPRTPPLSLSMPKAAQAHPNKPARAFVSGLLPDSEAALQRLGRKYGVSPNNFSVLLGSRDIRLAPLYDVATMLPYDQERGLRSAMRIGDTWDMAAVTDKDWAITERRLGLSPDESVSRARAVKGHIPAAFDHAVSEDKIPDSLRRRARWIAELITAHLHNRRNSWGSLDVAPWTGPATT
jgi:HipA-like protein